MGGLSEMRGSGFLEQASDLFTVVDQLGVPHQSASYLQRVVEGEGEPDGSACEGAKMRGRDTGRGRQSC